MQLEDWVAQFAAHSEVVIFRELSWLLLSKVVAVKGVFQSEGVCDVELFPADDSPSAHLVLLDLKAAVLVVEHVGFLSENSGQQSHDRPT